jgi:hypothetical protein
MSKRTDPGGTKGASMGGLEKSPERRKREAARRRREEQRWAAKSGPVATYVDPSRVESKSGDDAS